MKKTILSNDFDEFKALVDDVFCDHRIKLGKNHSGFHARLNVADCEIFNVVNLSYQAEVSIETYNQDLFLIQQATSGVGLVEQAGQKVHLQKGDAIPFNSECATRLDLLESFSQQAIVFDVSRINQICAQVLNRPLEDKVVFRFAPFSDRMMKVWNASMQTVMAIEPVIKDLSDISKSHLEDYLITTFLYGHSHNYSEAIAKKMQEMNSATPARDIASLGRDLMEASYMQPITINWIASELKVSTRTLETKFKEKFNSTPTEFLRRLRLNKARQELLDRSSKKSIGNIALDNGFFHVGRFCAYYKQEYKELPSETISKEHGIKYYG